MVLIAAEYGPTGAAELDDATEALLLHTLLKGARPVIVGGNPVGLLHVQNIMERIADANSLENNQDYYIGRYIVGDAVGLRAFSENLDELVETNIRGEDTGLTLNSLDEFGLIVVIAERADRLRLWAEQVTPLTSAPMLAITGFNAMPLSEPYLAANANKIPGMLVGYRDAYTYDNLVNILLGGGVVPTEITPSATPTNTFTPIGDVYAQQYADHYQYTNRNRHTDTNGHTRTRNRYAHAHADQYANQYVDADADSYAD